MLQTLFWGIGLFLASTGTSPAQLLKLNCRTQGPPFYMAQNSKVTHESTMDGNGCRYSFLTAQYEDRPGTYEKAVIAKAPEKGTLSQSGEFSFFYKPASGFKGKDTFSVYICGSTSHGSGCARVTYDITVR